MDVKELSKLTNHLWSTQKMPVLFLGYGSPMNAIEENIFVEGFRNIGARIDTPNAILCISAHYKKKMKRWSYSMIWLLVAL